MERIFKVVKDQMIQYKKKVAEVVARTRAATVSGGAVQAEATAAAAASSPTTQATSADTQKSGTETPAADTSTKTTEKPAQSPTTPSTPSTPATTKVSSSSAAVSSGTPAPTSSPSTAETPAEAAAEAVEEPANNKVAIGPLQMRVMNEGTKTWPIQQGDYAGVLVQWCKSAPNTERRPKGCLGSQMPIRSWKTTGLRQGS